MNDFHIARPRSTATTPAKQPRRTVNGSDPVSGSSLPATSQPPGYGRIGLRDDGAAPKQTAAEIIARSMHMEAQYERQYKTTTIGQRAIVRG